MHKDSGRHSLFTCTPPSELRERIINVHFWAYTTKPSIFARLVYHIRDLGYAAGVIYYTCCELAGVDGVGELIKLFAIAIKSDLILFCVVSVVRRLSHSFCQGFSLYIHLGSLGIGPCPVCDGDAVTPTPRFFHLLQSSLPYMFALENVHANSMSKINQRITAAANREVIVVLRQSAKGTKFFFENSDELF